MFCSQCGASVAEGANFCARCGAPVADGGQTSDGTTAAIEAGAFDPTESVQGPPDLEPGTGALIVLRGPNAGARFLLDRPTTTIGRHPESDIFLHDVTVSRRHATIEATGGELVLTDHGSLNGTYVNGERTEQRVLQRGDEVQVGRFKLLFLAGPEQPA